MYATPRSLITTVWLTLIAYTAATDFTIATWNSYDVVYGGSREARREYFFANKEALFGDVDILCTEEAHTYESINDFVTNFGEIYPYYHYNNDPSTTYQACVQSEIADFQNVSSPIYDCNELCTDSLPSSLGYIFCLWRCFGELRDNTTGVTTRANNPQLFDFGQALELSPCLSCLWRSNYVSPMTDSWTANNDTGPIMFEDILDVCTASQNTFDYKANEGIMLWSKYEFDSVEFVKLPEAVFTLRGYIKATLSSLDVTVICTHLETPTLNGVFGGKFTTMIQENIDAEVTELSNITQMDVDALVALIGGMEDNVILLGDLNIGINSRVDLYDALLDSAGLSNVFGTKQELSASVNCTRCASNPFTANQEIVDHILIKGDIMVGSAMRFLDGEYNTSAGMIPLSDHYGIKATLSVESAIDTTYNTPESTDNTDNTPESIDDSNAETIRYIVACAVVVLFVAVQ